jgi:hypothetical protein
MPRVIMHGVTPPHPIHLYNITIKHKDNFTFMFQHVFFISEQRMAMAEGWVDQDER